MVGSRIVMGFASCHTRRHLKVYCFFIGRVVGHRRGAVMLMVFFMSDFGLFDQRHTARHK